MTAGSVISRESALVLGLGLSGIAAARILAEQGYAVTVVDQGAGTAVEIPNGSWGVGSVQVLRHCRQLPEGRYALCVVSPGCDCDSEWVKRAYCLSAEVISELEFGWRYCRCPVLAVTGTNGKSTLTRLLSDILCAGGFRAEPSGNYGTPLSESALRSDTLDWIVAEVSSFQLELVKDFRPRIGIVLNIQPDHLERHGTFDRYVELKSRMLSKMAEEDIVFVYAQDDQLLRSVLGAVPQAWFRFGSGADCAVRYVPGEHCVHSDLPSAVVDIPLQGTIFDNPVLGRTAAAATGAALCAGADPFAIQQAIASFVALDHRMEDAGTIGGVRFIDDSKATNLSAVGAALEMTGDAPVRLIAGGRFKEKDANLIKEVLIKHVSSVYLIGECSNLFAKAWGKTVKCFCCGTLEKAVLAAWGDAVAGEVILLSPGCASFDQFRSYADRGEQFKDIVRRIACMSKGEGV